MSKPSKPESDIESINRALAIYKGEPFVICYYDVNQAVGEYLGVYNMPIKTDFNGLHIALGVATGEPIIESRDGEHWLWELPTGQKYTLLVQPEIHQWLEAEAIPMNLGGVHPSRHDFDSIESQQLNGYRRALIVPGMVQISYWLHHDARLRKHAKTIVSLIEEKLAA